MILIGSALEDSYWYSSYSQPLHENFSHSPSRMQLTKNQKFAVGGTVGFVGACIILFFVVRAAQNVDTKPDGKENDTKVVTYPKEVKKPVVSEELSSLVQQHFPDDEEIIIWGKNASYDVLGSYDKTSSVFFKAFFTNNFALNKAEMAIVFEATSNLLITQAKEYEASGKPKDSEMRIVNAAVCKSLSENLETHQLQGRARSKVCKVLLEDF